MSGSGILLKNGSYYTTMLLRSFDHVISVTMHTNTPPHTLRTGVRVSTHQREGGEGGKGGGSCRKRKEGGVRKLQRQRVERVRDG